MKKRQYILGIIFSLAVIIYVLATLDWQQVFQTLSNLIWHWVLAAFGVYLINYLLRAIRFRTLLDLGEIPFLNMFGLTGLYGMYLYLLPAKFGEVTFPVLLKQRLNMTLSKGTGSLIVARVFDFLTIALILPLILLLYWDRMPENFKLAALIFCGMILISFGIFVWLLNHSPQVLRFLESRPSSRPLLQQASGFVSNVYRGIQAIDQRKQYWQVFLITVGIWICVNGNFYLITRALGFDISFFQIVVVSLIMVPVTLFPIQGLANLGAHEIGWAAAFSLFGYAYADALEIAVSSHIVYLVFVLLLGLLGFLNLPGPGSIPQQPPAERDSLPKQP